MDIVKELVVREAADYISGYEPRRSTFAGIDRDDVTGFIENLCEIYENRINELSNEMTPADNMVSAQEYETLERDNAELKKELGRR